MRWKWTQTKQSTGIHQKIGEPKDKFSLGNPIFKCQSLLAKLPENGVARNYSLAFAMKRVVSRRSPSMVNTMGFSIIT